MISAEALPEKTAAGPAWSRKTAASSSARRRPPMSAPVALALKLTLSAFNKPAPRA